MAKKIYKLTPEIQEIVDGIENTGKTWYEMDLPDHPLYPIFKRKLVVTGFNTPDLENDDEDRIYISVREYLILKENEKIHKKIEMPIWSINENNSEQLLDDSGQQIVAEFTIEENGEIIDHGVDLVKVSSVQYIRYLIKTRSVHLADILQRFMPLYVQLYENQIDNI